ncbi:MAG: formylglycine-generating enzyme family protein, partial [Planctomycetes bacterium]|nr:formylglycine-generating enzyme family protein [Planctomycetota bacterium]
MGHVDELGGDSPPHTVYLDAYEIDKYEATNAQFVQFLNQVETSIEEDDKKDQLVHYQGEIIFKICLHCPHLGDLVTWDGSTYHILTGYETHPAVRVNWYGANAYCDWAGKRLPTEAQWEKAARGTDERVFPWGNKFDCQKGNFDDDTTVDLSMVSDEGVCDGYNFNAPVGSFPQGASPYQVHDMAGNVMEWVA